MEMPDAVFCTSDAMAMGMLDVCRALFPGNRPSAVPALWLSTICRCSDFDTYPIASIGYDKGVYVDEIVEVLIHPEEFVPGQQPVLVPTRFVPRATAGLV